jgi:hypothetical protein
MLSFNDVSVPIAKDTTHYVSLHTFSGASRPVTVQTLEVRYNN